MRATVMIVLTGLTLASCAPQISKVWVKPGAGQSEFAQDRYNCLQQSQQPASAGYFNQYGGYSRSNVITNGGLFDACMNSRGWSLAERAAFDNTGPYQGALASVIAEEEQICRRVDLMPFYQKSSCKAAEPTPEQLSDRTKISSEQKPALLKWRSTIDGENKKLEEIHRQYNPQAGDVIAALMEKYSNEGDTLTAELSNARITWGDFNSRRSDMAKRFAAEFNSVARNVH